MASDHPAPRLRVRGHRDESTSPPALVVTAAKTEPRYDLRCLDDLHAMLKQHGDWKPLATRTSRSRAADGAVEGWARSDSNPIGGWYGLK